MRLPVIVERKQRQDYTQSVNMRDQGFLICAFICPVLVVINLLGAISVGADSAMSARNTAFTFLSCRQQSSCHRDPFVYHKSSAHQSATRTGGDTRARTTSKAHTHSPTRINHHDHRGISSLQDWASENGVHFHSNVGLVLSSTHEASTSDADDDWGVMVLPVTTGDPQSTTTMNAGTVVLSVPRSLVLSSTKVADELVKEYKLDLQEATNILEDSGFANQTPDFFLFVKVLLESCKGKDSLWQPWLESLPHTFQTGVCMNSFEKSCLPPFAFALAEFETQKLRAFRRALSTLLEHPPASESLPHLIREVILKQQNGKDDGLIKWAYNVVFSRCWKYAEQMDDSADGSDSGIRSDIVPIGDMFNHADPGNVVVNYVEDSLHENDGDGDETAVKFVLNQHVQMDQVEFPELCLSYGLTTNPYRFLILFGFANTQMKEIYCQVLFTNPSKEMIELGCNDRAKMVYRTDGAISDTVCDVVLYSLLEQQVGNTEAEATRKILYQAHLNDDETTKTAIREKYLLESSLALRNHVERTLKEFSELVEKIDTIIEGSGDISLVDKEYPHLGMIHKHNKFVQGVFEKVKRRLDGMIQSETTRRRHTMADAQKQ